MLSNFGDIAELTTKCDGFFALWERGGGASPRDRRECLLGSSRRCRESMPCGQNEQRKSLGVRFG